MPRYHITPCLYFVVALITSPGVSLADSGNVDTACNISISEHYVKKAANLEKQKSFRDAAFAYTAASSSVARCPPTPHLLVFVYLIGESTARTEFNYATTVTNSPAIVDRWLHVARESLNRLAALRKVIQADSLPKIEKRFVATADSDRAITIQRVAALQIANDQIKTAAASRTEYGAGRYTGGTVFRPNRPAATDDCEKDSLSTVSEDGAFLATLGGGRYIIDDVDRVDTQLWLEADDVVVCADGNLVKIIHEGEIAHGHVAE